MAASPRPASLSLAHLSTAVGKAVDAAVAQHKVAVINKIAIGPGILVGPYLPLQPGVLEKAGAIAEQITAAANTAMTAPGAAARPIGGPLQPGFCVWDHVIICGFWPEPWVVVEAAASRE